MNIIIRSTIYNIFFAFWTVFIGLIFFPGLFLPKNNLFLKYTLKFWGLGLYHGVRIICNLKVEVRGLENIPKKPFIVASKHQSTLDVVILNALLDFPKYILRNSLIYVPVLGIYCFKAGMIFIDRSGGAKTLKTMLLKAQNALKQNEIIIIFPEGTRTSPEEKGKYNPGIAAIYNTCNVDVVPVALNTGVFWKKEAFLKKPGTFTVEFLKPIKPGLSKRDFLIQLENDIETSCSKLEKN